MTALLLAGLLPAAQRQYATTSVLAGGQWAKITADKPGIYKIDAAFLSSLGFSSSFPSAQLRLFGRPAGMLPEGNSAAYVDDLQELAVEIVDGGDGVFSSADYALFYAEGPHPWVKDSVQKTFRHQKNLYTESQSFFITIGGAGKRIAAAQTSLNPFNTVTTFTERFFHELDSVNFLSSGKEWYGEEFADAPGHVLSKTFPFPFNDVMTGTPVQLTSSVASRSVGAGSRFVVSSNSQAVQQLPVPAIDGLPYGLFAQQAQASVEFAATTQNVSFSFQYLPGSFNAQGWLNWFEVVCRRPLSIYNGEQLLFRDWESVGNTSATFSISTSSSNTQVWDVTDELAPVKLPVTYANGQATFTNSAVRLHEYVAFNNNFLTPQAAGAINNQNLHATTETDYFIITHPLFLQQAERLALFHQQKNGLRTLVVTTKHIFNEFAGGAPDPTAVKDFLKLYYDRYKATWKNSPKYAVLFGKASFDYKDRIVNNTAFVPSYQSPSSLDPLSTFTSDDFFGFLDDEEDINSVLVMNGLDLGIGRVPVRSPEEAKAFVDKVEAYHAAAAFGPWRNEVTFIADDEDNNLHLQDAETIAGTTLATAPVFNINKYYLDAYRQEGGSAGGRYPQANAAINNRVYNGTLIWNYSGHGGPQRLAEEVLLDRQVVESWNNRAKLPLLITATCDFAPFDYPFDQSLGENVLVRPQTGAIALMTTTRLVFANSNRVLNNNYLKFALEKTGNGYRSLGEAAMLAKNYTYQTSTDVVNTRKFALLGDPAMTLAFPKLQVQATTVNGKTIGHADTLSATDAVTIGGEVRDEAGALLPGFNGTVYLSLFDKPKTITTLGNDAGSPPTPFSTQNTVLFKGKATAQNGLFSFYFKLPKDMNYQPGFGKLSLYAEDGITDGNGHYDSLVIGGMGTGGGNDGEGPHIKAYLNDEQFVNGGIAGNSPVLIVKLADSSGINTGGASIDHDIVATLDGDAKTYYVLNNFYESELDNYQKGSIRFQLPQLPPGPHTLTIKAWDVMNNSATYELSFTIVDKAEMIINHVLNYPNPFTTQTAFWFEHNQPQTDLKVKIDVYTVSGKLVKTISRAINTPGNRSNDIVWDGRDQYGAKVGRGIYIYRLQVTAPGGKKAEKWERMALLN
ncbi:MAG: type IX secretion system sortase PorU [Chitinophagaceae bacterium]